MAVGSIPGQVARLARAHHRQIYQLERAQQRRFRELSERSRVKLVARLKTLIAEGKGGGFEAHQARIAITLANAAREELVRDLDEFVTDITAQEGRRIGAEHAAREVGSWAAHYGNELRPLNIEAVLQLDNPTLIERHPRSIETYGMAINNRIRAALQDSKLARENLDSLEATIADVINGERWRARRIIRTELSDAYNATHLQMLEAAEDEGIKSQKICIVTYDARTADDSLALEGQVRDLDEMFEDGLGRRYLHPPGRPNDREKMVPYIGPDAFGEPKPKPAPAPKPAPKPEPEPEAKAAGVRWPGHPGELDFVQNLGGSTGAQLMQDPETGQKFVMKRGASPEHIKSEMAADSAYLAAGMKVPPFREYADEDGNPIKLAEFIEGTPIGRWKPKTSAERHRMLDELQAGFGMDAMLGNWDVIGMGGDNVLITPDGIPYRIDNGGALGFRAQGERKSGEEWGANLGDLWSMRDGKINPDAAKYFKDVTWRKMRDDLERVDLDAVLKTMQGADRAVFAARVAELKEMTTLSRTMEVDKYYGSYDDQFIRQVQGIRAAGITDLLPRKMMAEVNTSTINDPDPRAKRYRTDAVFDEKGDRFDDLRGSQSTTAKFQDYMERNGGDTALFKRYVRDQKGDSWTPTPQAIKWHYANNVRGTDADYWWRDGVGDAQRHHAVMMTHKTRDQVDKTIAMQHAYTYEMINKMNMQNKGKGGLKLFRTEEQVVPDIYDLDLGGKNQEYLKGPLESTSIFNPVYVHGDCLMQYHDVPVHRVFVAYFQSEGADNQDVLLGDGENEFVVDLDGVKSDYLAKGRYRGY